MEVELFSHCRCLNMHNMDCLINLLDMLLHIKASLEEQSTFKFLHTYVIQKKGDHRQWWGWKVLILPADRKLSTNNDVQNTVTAHLCLKQGTLKAAKKTIDAGSRSCWQSAHCHCASLLYALQIAPCVPAMISVPGERAVEDHTL